MDDARRALGQLTEAQRLALVAEVINQSALPTSHLQLTRIGNIARAVSEDLELSEFVKKETRACR
ncbi:hypothetical protein HKX23_17700 [Sulfitobacter sp. KE29]|nr:hypothetical protein [Sulfitobacter sp. KE29]